MAIVRREISDRTVAGKIFKYLFIAFNILMLCLCVLSCVSVSHSMDNTQAVAAEYRDAAQAGVAVGASLIYFTLGTIWVIGDIILGIIVLLTRRKKVIETEE